MKNSFLQKEGVWGSNDNAERGIMGMQSPSVVASIPGTLWTIRL